MKKLIGLVGAGALLAGCQTFSSYNPSNVQWVYDNGIKPVIEVLPSESFIEKYKQLSGDLIGQNVNCFYYPQDFLVGETKATIHRIVVKEGKEKCLEHEFGHIRERLEGVPPHSKYAL